MKEIRGLGIILILLFNFSLNSQTDTLIQSEDLPTDQVEVIKNFRANVVNASAVLYSPEIEEIERERQVFVYDFEIPRIEFDPPEPKLRPLAYDEPLIRELHDGFLDLSFGTLSFPKLEAGYHYNIEDWFELGFTGKYYVIDDDEVEFRDVNHTDINAYGSFRLSPSLKLKAGLDYFLDDRYFYAKPLSLLADDQDSLNRSFNRFAFNGGINYTQNKTNGLFAELMFKYWQTDIDNFGINEDVFDLDLKLNKIIKDRMVFSLDALLRSYSSDQENFDVSTDISYINIDPQLRYQNENTTLRISAEINKLGDSSLVLAPSLVIKRDINENFSLTGGYSSLYQVQDANHIYQANPLSSFIFYQYQAYQLNKVFAQPEIKQGGKRFALEIAYNFERNALVNDFTLDPNLFSFSRVDSDNYLSFSPTIEFSDLPVNIVLNGHYRLRNDSKHFLPDWDLNIQLSKSLMEEKLNLQLSYRLVDRYNLVLNANPELARQNELLNGLSLSARYKVLDKLSLYVSGDNILDQQYEFANNYLTYGMLIRGGLFVKF